MSSGKSVAGYPITFFVFLAVFVVLGAIALTLIFTGPPAFPVRVFGSATTRENIEAVDWIRPASVERIPRGRFDRSQLLPLPPVLPPGKYGNPDPLYASLPTEASQAQLDRARLAAQAGNTDLSLSVYSQLIRAYPNNRMLLMEQISVLSSVGRHREAANRIMASLPLYPRDYELHMAAARNLWWSNQPFAADSMIGVVLQLSPGSEEALRLREQIRPTTQPDIATAQRWADASTGVTEPLLLARAYVRAQRFGEAIAPYRTVIARAQPTDSLLLEVASAAAAADSLQVLDEMTRLLIARNPNDFEARLRLARAYSWNRDYARSAQLYSEVIQMTGDPAIMLEHANVLLWSGREAEAKVEVERVLQYSPRNIEALKLAGDLAYYRADWKAALSYYRSAAVINPLYPGLATALGQAETQLEQARLAALTPMTPNAYDVGMDMYLDNQNYRWIAMHAGRTFTSSSSSVRIVGEHNIAEQPLGGGIAVNPGYAVRADGQLRVNDGFTLLASAGVSSFSAVGTIPQFAVGVTIHDFLGTDATVRYARGPGAQRLTSLAALQAEAVSEVIGASFTHSSGPWSLGASIEDEKITTSLGGSNRAIFSANATRRLNDKWSVGAAVTALSTDAAAPVAAGWGPLYWSPEQYMEPVLRLSYRHRMSERFSMEAAVQSGYAFVRERAADRRFAGSAVPTAGAQIDIRYQSGPWAVGAAASYGGAVSNGYRAGTVRIQGSYRVGR